jgi:uncharacterized membrane protein
VKRALWAVVIVLAALAVSSALVRTIVTIRPSAALAASQREAFRSVNANEALIHIYETRFASRPVMTLLHVVPGVLFLSFGLLQFSTRVRGRHPAFHRWSGRVLMTAALVSGAAGCYFGVIIPIAGFGEASIIALAGAWLMVSVARGFIAIRSGDVAGHRVWMIRAFAPALAVGTIRVIALIVQLWMPISPAATVVVSFWSGWVLTLGAAELWIRATSTSARTYNSAVRGIGTASP